MDQTTCPLCGGSNECGVAAGKSDCWCFKTPVPSGVTARVPEDAQGKACVCERCATQGSNRGRDKGDGLPSDPPGRID